MPDHEDMPYVIPGFHPVREVLSRGQLQVEELWVEQGKESGRMRELFGIARERGIPVRFKKGSELSRLLPGTIHQGIVALAERFIYAHLDWLISCCEKNRGRVLLVAADHITDEGNMGGLIRAAAFFGAQGLILPKDRSAAVSPRVLKRSSGTCAYLAISRVPNLGRALDRLEREGLWVIGASGGGSETIYQFDWKRDVVIAFGSEQRGLSKSVLKRCHQVVSIPSPGNVESLNVAAACAITLSEIVRQRNLPRLSSSG